jgi:hypothetical protein
MKDVTTRRHRYLEAGLMVYLTSADRQRLRQILKAEGIYSASSWFRQMAMRKLREGAQEGAEHDIDPR